MDQIRQFVTQTSHSWRTDFWRAFYTPPPFSFRAQPPCSSLTQPLPAYPVQTDQLRSYSFPTDPTSMLKNTHYLFLYSSVLS